MTVDELMDVAQILQQFPRLAERRGDQLDQGLGKIGRDVLVRERRAERGRMTGLRDLARGRDAQRFLLDAFAPAAQHRPFAGIDESRQPALEFLVDHVTHAPRIPADLGSRQLGNDLDFNEESRVHQTLYLHPRGASANVLCRSTRSAVRCFEQGIHIRRVDRLFDDFFEIGAVRRKRAPYVAV